MTTIRTPKSAKPRAKPASKPTVTKRKRGKPMVEIDLDRSSQPAAVTDPAAKPASGLDVAALVLREAGEPLDTKALVARMLERGLWSTSGKTPAATIYSAIIREISAKGSASRFSKSGPGMFSATA